MKVKEYFLDGLFSPHSGDKKTLQDQIHWTLRITAALCFIGHGTWGLITKSGWLPFFASQGIEPEIAWMMQPLIGAFDILMAVILLRKPSRAIFNLDVFMGPLDRDFASSCWKPRKSTSRW